MIKGSCLCGKVQYTYDGEIDEISMCHCSQCRKAHGSAFVAVCPVDSAKLKLSGAEHIKEYRTNDVKVRAFCSNCGSPLYSARSDLPEVKRLRLGSVETDFDCENKYHKFVASKAAWDSIADGYPQYSENNN